MSRPLVLKDGERPVRARASGWRAIEPGVPDDGCSGEWFSLRADGRVATRTVRLRDGSSHSTEFRLDEPVRGKPNGRLGRWVDLAFLRSRVWPEVKAAGEPVRVVDLFSGCGAMTLGAWEACRAIGKRLEVALALDSNRQVLEVFHRNFRGAKIRVCDVGNVLDSPLGQPPSASEAKLKEDVGRVDLLLGGPPCQGHSDLNNHTRRVDPKNGLYDRMARFAEIARPAHIIIENVPAVLHDRQCIVQKTLEHLSACGYNVDHCVADASWLGVAQERRRHILVASSRFKFDLNDILSKYACGPVTVGFVIRDLLHVRPTLCIDRPASMHVGSQRRIEYLFRTGQHDLPDGRRPPCHRLNEHSYRSVYGRMFWNRPAQTITSGFTCMGQGRFVHPKRKRTLTPHEAARLQFLPDFFGFGEAIPRTLLAEMVANAVPPKLTYVLALELLR